MTINVEFKAGLAPVGFREGVMYRILSFDVSADEVLIGDTESGVFAFIDITSFLLAGYGASNEPIITVEIKEGKAPDGFETGKRYLVLVTDLDKKRFVLADAETKAIDFIKIEDCIRVS